jgi:hypothetical protein
MVDYIRKINIWARLNIKNINVFFRNPIARVQN